MLKERLFKWLTITLIIIFSVGIGSLIYCSYNTNRFYELREYLNQNSIELVTNDNLNSNEITIYWQSEVNNGEVIKNGQLTDLIYKEYGINRFSILYKKDTIKKFMYFKSNNWHGHKHIIVLSKLNDTEVEANVEIVGPDVY